MNACFAREATRVTALLEALLKEIGSSTDEGGRKGLDQVQSRWIAYRDAQCHWVAASSQGGSVQPTVHAGCLANLAWERIGQLKLALCEGGAGLGNSCVASRRYDRPRDQ
jgi:uncharacterized protein YecT (DUF1311 family)